ncbi:hypothetical protein ABVC73_01665 [Prevotella melaninogenica]
MRQLNTVSLGASLSNVTANPFSNCTALKEFVVDQASATFMADGHALIRKGDGTLVSFPCALGWFYKLALLYFELIFEVKMQESEGV